LSGLAGEFAARPGSPRELRELLERHGLAPSRRRGQNFLVDEALADRLAEAAGVEPGDAVIEVGTGLAILTRALARRGARVLTVEVDAGLVRALEAEALLPEGAALVHADALALDWPALVERVRGPGPGAGARAVRVVANLPYSVATPLLRRLLDLRDRLADWSVMVQREVARRVTAEPGSPDYGSLAVLHALCAEARRELDLGPAAFHPAPRVASRFLRVVPRRDAGLGPGELERVEAVARALFTRRRKTALRALRQAGWSEGAARRALADAGAPERARAEDLEPERLRALAAALPGALPAPGAAGSPGADPEVPPGAAGRSRRSGREGA